MATKTWVNKYGFSTDMEYIKRLADDTTMAANYLQNRANNLAKGENGFIMNNDFNMKDMKDFKDCINNIHFLTENILDYINKTMPDDTLTKEI